MLMSKGINRLGIMFRSDRKSPYNLQCIMITGGKFLKKLWCCVAGRIKQGNFVLPTDCKEF